MFVRIIDSNGYFVEDAFVDELTESTIETPCPDGFYHPKWNGAEWVEGMSAEEIEALKSSTVTEPTDAERISALETLVLQMGSII